MSELVPARYLFRFELSLHRLRRPVTIDGDLADWPDACRLPPLHRLEGKLTFADLWAGWNDEGLYLACRVRGKTRPPRCEPEKFWKSDHLRLMTDMRDARDIRRATRFCQHFYFMPTGGGRDRRQSVAGTHRIQRATTHAPLVAGDRLAVAAELLEDGYALEAHIPATALAGFNPAEQGRIGLCTVVEDQEHGQQSLTVGDDLNWYYDPSTWATAVLVN